MHCCVVFVYLLQLTLSLLLFSLHPSSLQESDSLDDDNDGNSGNDGSNSDDGYGSDASGGRGSGGSGGGLNRHVKVRLSVSNLV